MKFILVSFVMVILAVSQVNANPVDVCPETEEVVWALGVECVVFRNECYFDRAASAHIPRKCSKTKTNELEYHDITMLSIVTIHVSSALKIVSKEECQKYCNAFCSSVFDPVSGTYNGEVIFFSNQCKKDLFSCQTGKSRWNHFRKTKTCFLTYCFAAFLD